MRTEVPEGWTAEPLGTLAQIVGGSGFPHSHQGKDGLEFPFVKVSDMNSPGNERVVRYAANTVSHVHLAELGATPYPPGTTVFPKVGAALLTNKRRVLGVHAAFDNNVMGVIVRERLDSEFLFQWTQTVDFALHVQRGAVPSVNQSTVSSLRVALPPLPEQKKIAAILSSVDEAIQATQAVIEQTRRVKEGLLQDLLTRGIGHTRFKQTEIGEIPESWNVRRFGDVVELRHGFQFRTHHFRDAGVRVIKIQNVTARGVLDWANCDFVHEELVQDLGRFLLNQGDILMSLTGNIGRVCRVPPGTPPLLQNYRVGRFVPKESLAPDYLVWLLQSPLLLNQLLVRANTTAQANIGKAEMAKALVPVPSSTNEQREVSDRLSVIESFERRAEASALTLDTLKAGLLQDLLTGKVRVAA